MKKSVVLCALTLAASLTSLEASALTLNGLSYKAVPTKQTTCQDKISPIMYNKVKYCRTYKANIGWTAPIRRVNGTSLALNEIANYEVYWTRTVDSRSGVIKVTGAALATALEVFTPDTYHFAISAIDTKGLKSPLSSVVSSALK